MPPGTNCEVLASRTTCGCFVTVAGNSPDLNPIENLWVILKRKVAARNPTSASDLKEAIKHVWCDEITQELCQKLVHSMPDRISAVLRNRGQCTKY